MGTFNLICNFIILIGGVVGAITAIAALCGKPIVFFKKRKKKEKEQEASDLVKTIKNTLTPEFDELKQTLGEQSEILDEHSVELTHLTEQMTAANQLNSILVTTTKDLLRKSILKLYTDHKQERQLTETERELLDELFSDYKAENGNSYIEKIYHRMEKWNVIPDEDD